jgi:hypothetical protein
MKIFMLALFVICFLPQKISAKNYEAASNEEIDIFAAVLKFEISQNGWKDCDIICFQISGKDPSKKLVDTLRSHKLNVCSQADWRKRLACRYSVYLVPADFLSQQEAKMAFHSFDYRDVNTGSAHFTDLLREGDYLLRKIDAQWVIVEYIPDKFLNNSR